MNACRRRVLLAAVLVVGFFCVAARGQLSDAGSTKDKPSFEDRLEVLYEAVRGGRNDEVTFGSLATLNAYIHDLRLVKNKDERYENRMAARISDILDAGEDKRDLLAKERGFLWRGYSSRYSQRPQMYSIYVPDDYDPEVPIPLIVTLHGGSSNHNVWLAINLGNKISVADYWGSFRSEYRAKRHPNAIVAAPDGLGQIRWRWSGEQDVLDVIDDVSANYNINADKVFLTGLSNGGIGAYTIGLKHSSRFAAVLPVAGVTDWLNHHEADGRWRSCERNVLRNESAITYAANAANTHLRFYHGLNDPGFDVEQARSLAEKLERLAIPFKYHEFKYGGHDLGYVLWRKLLIMRYVRKYSRQVASPSIKLVTASGHANRQGWLALNNRLDHTRPGYLDADVIDDGLIRVRTNNVQRFSILTTEAPIASPFSVQVDGQTVYSGPVPQDNRLTLRASLAPVEGMDGEKVVAQPMWEQWDGSLAPAGTTKTDTLSGPIGDANYEKQIHVYGTLVEDDVVALKKAAYLGARGWMMARDYTEIRHQVIPDSRLTWEMMRDNAIVLYGNGSNNSVLQEIGDRLPIVVGPKHLELRGRKISGWGVGARFICPNPLMPGRYLVVATGTSAEAVESGGRLPIYLADYMVYNHQTVRRKAFMILGGRKEIETGYFTEDWKLPDKRPDR